MELAYLYIFISKDTCSGNHPLFYGHKCTSEKESEIRREPHSQDLRGTILGTGRISGDDDVIFKKLGMVH